MKAPHATSEILFESGVRVTKLWVWSNDFAFLRALRRNLLVIRVESFNNGLPWSRALLSSLGD